MNKNRTILIVVVLLILGLISFRLISNKKNIDSKKQVKNTGDIRASVNIAVAVQKTSELNLSLVGTVTANQEIDIKSEVSGKITSLNFKLGDFVTKGKILARVDNRIRELASQNAQERLADAKQNLERYKNLFDGGAATKAQMDQYQLAYTTAKIQLDQAGKDLSNTSISAPISGYITTKSVEAGDFTNIGTAIATIVDISKLKVQLSVAEKDAYALKTGDTVQISSQVYPGVTFKGIVTFVSFRGDAAHNYPIEISIENQVKNSLKAGSYVDIAFNRKSTVQTLQIPRESLLGSIKDARVYIVTDSNTVHLKRITISGENSNFLEVSYGLSQGDKVVTSGQINLNEGSTVAIIK